MRILDCPNIILWILKKTAHQQHVQAFWTKHRRTPTNSAGMLGHAHRDSAVFSFCSLHNNFIFVWVRPLPVPDIYHAPHPQVPAVGAHTLGGEVAHQPGDRHQQPVIVLERGHPLQQQPRCARPLHLVHHLEDAWAGGAGWVAGQRGCGANRFYI